MFPKERPVDLGGISAGDRSACNVMGLPKKDLGRILGDECDTLDGAGETKYRSIFACCKVAPCSPTTLRMVVLPAVWGGGRLTPPAGASFGGEVNGRLTNCSKTSGGDCRPPWVNAGGVGVSDAVDQVSWGGGESKSAKA